MAWNRQGSHVIPQTSSRLCLSSLKNQTPFPGFLPHPPLHKSKLPLHSFLLPSNDAVPSMEPPTKKRTTAEGATEEMRKKTKSAITHEQEPEEKEVEEFFAILRRLHVALQYFHKRSPSAATTSTAWQPTFELQDFQELLDGNSGFDLNSQPTFKHHRRG